MILPPSRDHGGVRGLNGVSCGPSRQLSRVGTTTPMEAQRVGRKHPAMDISTAARRRQHEQDKPGGPQQSPLLLNFLLQKVGPNLVGLPCRHAPKLGGVSLSRCVCGGRGGGLGSQETQPISVLEEVDPKSHWVIKIK